LGKSQGEDKYRKALYTYQKDQFHKIPLPDFDAGKAGKVSTVNDER